MSQNKLALTTWSGLIRKVTDTYLQSLDLDEDNEPQDIAAEILEQEVQAISQHNNDTQDKWPLPQDLLPQQIASCMARLHHVILLGLTPENSSEDYDTLAIYETKGPRKGIYSTDDDEFVDLAREYKYDLTTRQIKEVLSALRSMVPHKVRNQNPDLIPVNNGIFNYKTKTLLPFDPELIFISKSKVNYNSHAKNITIHNDKDGSDWDVVHWMNSLSDDPEIVHILWQMLGAIIRPNVSWDMSAWLYSTKGSNGKGTLCELMRNLCGQGSYAKIALNDFSQDFMLEPLVHASAIIVDENDVGSYIDKAANLKAVVTGDVITINRKFKDPINYQFKGFMVQCLNEFPKVKDKSGSFYRRLMFVPMTKNFKGHERKYIKQDYLHRKDVLEYVMYHILHDTNYYALDIPKACQDTLEDYKEFNDPIRQFISDILPVVKWDLLPFKFLYDLYLAWIRHNVPKGMPVSYRSFTAELHEIFDNETVRNFTCHGDGQTRTLNKMDRAEPLILEYNLTSWMNRSASGNDTNALATPMVRARYRGLVRVAHNDDPDDDNKKEENN